MTWLSSSALAWYNLNKREMPWRKTRDPYKIWLSEVILQQTRISQGLPYYSKFISAFPTVDLLALSSEDQVLNLWQGLGYYSRARNLHETAKRIHFDYAGKFPGSAEELGQLKGVGTYTSGAIASICFGQRVPAVDGNVYRLLSRLFQIEEPIDSNKGKKMFYGLAMEQMPRHSPGDFNQALMEIGATVCLPKNPKCTICPFQKKCHAYKNKSQTQYPVKSKKIKIVSREVDLFVIRMGNKIVLEKRKDKDIWKGLYSFPMIDSNKMTLIIKKWNIKKNNLTQIGACMKHILTHQVITARFYEINVQKEINSETNWIYVNEESIGTYPVSKLMVKFLDNYELTSLHV